jgi:hypothetical protein
MSSATGGVPIQHWWEPSPHIKATMDGIVVAVIAVVLFLAAVYIFLIAAAVAWQGYVVATGHAWLAPTAALLLALGAYLCFRK